MSRHAPRLVRAALLPTLMLVVVVWLAPGRIELAVRIYVLVVCLVALIALLRALRAAYPTHESSLESALVRSGRVSPSVVTCRSCIASSSAACVFGGARLSRRREGCW